MYNIPTVTPVTTYTKQPLQITYQQYYDMLYGHDWFFSYSDDNSVYCKGYDNQEALMEIANRSTKASVMFHLFEDKVHSVGGGKPTVQQCKDAINLALGK